MNLEYFVVKLKSADKLNGFVEVAEERQYSRRLLSVFLALTIIALSLPLPIIGSVMPVSADFTQTADIQNFLHERRHRG